MTETPSRLNARPWVAALVLGASLYAGAASAQSASLNIQIDRSQRVSLRGTAASVIVGNKDIADVTIVDANTLFITGKGYGVTEVVAVDAIGRTLFNNQVVVTGGTTGSVRMWRGGKVTEMACASSCSPSVRTFGDSGSAAPAAATGASPTP